MDKRDSFDIDDTGEEIAYITLPQAVIKARQVVRQEDAYYRERLGWQEIVWTEKQYEKRDDYYWVVLKFSQPARGIAEVQTGEEEFVFDEVGNLVDRQVLLWPDGSSAPVEQDPTPEPSQPDITESSPKHSYTPTPTSASHPYADTIVSEPPDTSPRQSGSPYEPPLHAERTGVYLASPRRRIAAFVFDLILYTVTVGSAAGIGEWLNPGSDISIVAIWVVNFIWIAIWLYGASRGWSPGKLIVGIRIVDHSQAKPGWRTALMRELIGKFISAFPLYLGFLWILWDNERRGWHDRIAKTHVIKV